VDIAGPGHADIHLAQEKDIGSGTIHELPDRVGPLQPFGVQGGNAQPVRAGRFLSRRLKFDSVKSPDPIQKILMRRRVGRRPARLFEKGGIRTGQISEDPVDYGAQGTGSLRSSAPEPGDNAALRDRERRTQKKIRTGLGTSLSLWDY
jgi:hypothetical protein